MHELILRAVGRLGVSEPSARRAAAELLGMLREGIEPEDFDRLLDRVSGARELIGQPRHAGTLPDGLERLTARRSTPDDQGDPPPNRVIAQLGRSGINLVQAIPFLSMFFELLRETLGHPFVERVTERLPELALIGG